MRLQTLVAATGLVALLTAPTAAQGQQDFSKVEIVTTKISDNFVALEGQGGRIGEARGVIGHEEMLSIPQRQTFGPQGRGDDRNAASSSFGRNVSRRLLSDQMGSRLGGASDDALRKSDSAFLNGGV